MPRLTVLCVRRYDFPDASTGRRVEGCKVTYLDEPANLPDLRGIPPMTSPAPLSMFDEFHTLPGKYDLDFAMVPDSKGKPVLSVRSAVFFGQSEGHAGSNTA